MMLHLDYDFIDLDGPSTYKEIDHLFQEYCKTSSHKNRTPSNSTRKYGVPVRLPSGTSLGKIGSPKQIDTTTTPMNRKPQPESQINQSFLNQQDKSPHVHIQEPVDTFASRVHNLISKTAIPGWIMSEDDATQIAQDFGISLPRLSTLNTHEERHKYVVECLLKSVNDDLREFNKKHHVRQAHRSHFDEEYRKYKEKLKADNADIFAWLNVKTPHDALKKKLRSKLAETITDQENQSIIEASLEEIRNTSKDASRVSTTKKIMLENIPVVDNIEILQKVLDGQSDNLLKMTKSVKNANRRQHDSLDKTQKSQFYINVENNKGDKLDENEADSQPGQKQEWSPDKERTFKLYREHAKSLLFDRIKSSSWNGLGFSPMMQASLKDEKSKLQRDTKLANYMSGDLLTPEEYKLLASTSVTLNKFVDKKYLQTVVNNLDPDVVEAIEIDIAEKTLMDHETRQKDIKNSRLEFIKQKNQALLDKIHYKDGKLQNKMKVTQGMYEQKKIKQRAINMINKSEERKRWKLSSEQKVAKSKPKIQDIAVDIGHFASKFLKVVDDKVATRKLKSAKDFLRRLLPSPPSKPPVDLEASRHAYHPSSKLIVKAGNRSNDYLGLGTDNVNPTVAKRKNDSMDLFKLHIHSPPNLKDRRKFKSFYSGGPVDNEERIFQGNYIFGDVSTYKVDKFQYSVVIRIQAAWRGYKQRKFFRQLQERIKEKSRTTARMEFLKNNTDSKFLKVVLQSQEKFQGQRHHRNRSSAIEDQTSLPTSMSNIGGDSGKRNSKAVYDLKMILNKGLKKQGTYQSSAPHSKEIVKVKSFESIEDHFKNDESSVGRKGNNLTKIDETTHKVKPKPPLKLSRNVNSAVNISRKNRNLEANHSRQPSENTNLIEFDGSVERTRDNKIAQRAAPKGLLLKQRKLFVAAKSSNYNLILTSSFNYFEADVNIKDDKGNSPLFYAAKNGDKQICEFLVLHKAFVNEPCSGGNTPLHMAFASGQVMVVILLLSNGGNLNILNENGQTPIAFGNERLLALLNLKDATATYNVHTNSVKALPKDMDNNRFLSRSGTRANLDNDHLSFDYQALEKPLGKVIPENKDKEIQKVTSPKQQKRASIENSLKF